MSHKSTAESIQDKTFEDVVNDYKKLNERCEEALKRIRKKKNRIHEVNYAG